MFENIRDETLYQTEKIYHNNISQKISQDNNKPRNYQIYHGGTDNAHTGVGIVIEMNGNMKPTYQKVTSRIIKAGLQVDKVHHMNVIVAYAPTLVKSEE